jgi:two-component sensor histidine kinase
MVLHELVTNAAKYGAFATAEGSLRVSWHLDEKGDVLIFKWQETGISSEPNPATRIGFGSRLIDTSGGLERRWTDGALSLEARIPLSHVLLPS